MLWVSSQHGPRQRLFGIRISAADGEAPLQHSDVRVFRGRAASAKALIRHSGLVAAA